MIAGLKTPAFQASRQSPPLRPGEVHLWQIRLDHPETEETAPLSPEEWLRAWRFHHTVDRERYICAHSALRRILAGYTGEKPNVLTFHRNPHGKPALPGGLLRFNLSHSDDLMLLGVTHGREIGVDIEKVRENLPFEMLSDHYFPPEDQWSLRTTPSAQRLAKFFELWTRIEARLKAHGSGLGETSEVPDPDRFTLQSFLPADGYAGALAVEGRDFQLSCWQWLN